MKLNLLFLNANAVTSKAQKDYVTQTKDSLSIRKGCRKQENQCAAHFLCGTEITVAKVTEMIKKKGITKITFKGVDEKFITQLLKVLEKRLTNKCFALSANGILTVTAKESITVEKSEKLAVA